MNTVKGRILLVIFVAGVLPLVSIFFVMKSKTTEAIVKSNFDKMGAVAFEVARQVATSMERSSNDLGSLRSNPLVVGADVPMEAREQEMKRLVDAYERFSDITLYGPDGFMIVSTTALNHPEPQEFHRWFVEARDTETVRTSRPHRVTGQEGLHIKVYIPVRIDGIGVCVMNARLTFDEIWERIEGGALGNGGRIVLLDSRGNILADENRERVLSRFDGSVESEFWLSEGQGHYRDPVGEEFLFSAVKMGEATTKVGEEWTLLALLPEEQVVAAVSQNNRFLYLAGGVALLFSAGLGLAVARQISEPFVSASEAALEVTKGDLNVNIRVKGPREMKRMASSFNTMIDEVREHRFRLEMLVDSRTKKLRKSQQELEDLSAQLQATYESVPEAILVVRAGGTILTANRQMREFFHLEGDLAHLPASRFEARLIESFHDAEEVRERWDALAASPEAEYEAEWVAERPVHRVLVVYTAPVRNRQGVVFARLWMFRDVTERRQLEQGLQQAQKMEAIGRLAGGVAHDFNNLLTGILGNLNLAEMEGTNAGQAGECLLSAKVAGQRAAELVKQLLGFSRQARLELRQRDANGVMKEVHGILRYTLDPRIRLEQDLGERLWGAKIDVTQISQVIMNMCVNAKDAMPGGGVIRLGSRNVTVSESDVAGQVGARAGDFIMLSVEDEGEGMAPEVLEKIFEPFFTTKEQGKGTGLGLATSYGIVQQHNGWIACDSVPGRGTRFDIYLPRDESGERMAEESRVPETRASGGEETILLVDDEAVVRGVAAGVLKRYGYRILTASDGIEGLERIAEAGGGIDLVLLDLTMPRLSGRDTFRRIRAEFGDLPVVVCSGYLVDLDEFAEETGARPNGFVQKPYSVKDLATCVRTVLDGHAETHSLAGLNA